MKNVLLSISSSLRKLPETNRTIVVTVLLSLASAGTAVAFLFLTNHLFDWTFRWFASRSTVFFLIMSFITIIGSSLVVGLLLNRISPEAAGSGIPQLKAAYWTELGYVPIKPILVKFVAGVLSLGGGTSLGREGPTVYMGGGVASWLSGFTGAAKRERRNPSLIGASAGLAAAFNTPLASITFVLEEIVGDLSSRSIGRVLLSSIIGAFTVYALIGRQPAFQVPSLEEVSWLHYALAPLVALAASLLGVVFQRQALAWRKRLKSQKAVPSWLLPVFGGLITWCIGAPIFLATGKLGVFSLGYQDLSSVLRNDYIWWVAGAMIACKLLATIASYSFGGCGGIFSPLLFIGGMTGYFIGGLFSRWLHLTPSDLIILSAVGMSTCLGTVVKAPLSAMLIVFEMTHQFALVPTLLIGMIISMAVSRLSGSENFYDAILVQDGHELHKIRPPQDLTGWQNLPVSAIANKCPTVITSLDRPSLEKAISDHPYACFPLVLDGELRGILTREDITASLTGRERPTVAPAVVCSPEESIHEVAERFLDSTNGFIVLQDKGNLQVSGILTLHDILRAQVAATE